MLVLPPWFSGSESSRRSELLHRLSSSLSVIGLPSDKISLEIMVARRGDQGEEETEEIRLLLTLFFAAASFSAFSLSSPSPMIDDHNTRSQSSK